MVNFSSCTVELWMHSGDSGLLSSGQLEQLLKFKLRNYQITKIQIKKLSLLLSSYFHVILEHLKTFIQTNFRFKTVLCFVIQDA